MSDGRLRDLERAFRETGSAEDEAAWLRERVRAGTPSGPQLELAAALGHGPARLALGPEGDWPGLAEVFGSPSSPRVEHLERADDWVGRFWQAGPEFARRAWLRLAATTLEHHGQADLARRVGRANDAELKQLAEDAEQTLRRTNPARGICFELSDGQAESLQRDVEDWRRRHVGDHVLSRLPAAIEKAREGSLTHTHWALIEHGLGPVDSFVAWILRQRGARGVRLVPPPSNPAEPRA